MFEKEAEESSKKAFCIAHTHEDELIYRNGFQQGAEFGYNKGRNEAKEILMKLLEEEKDNMYWEMNGSDKSSYYEIRKQAEQFIEESEVEK